MARLSEDELLRLACIYAEQDRDSFIQAHENMPNDPAAKRARSVLKQLHAYRMRRWGATPLEKDLERAESVPFPEAIRRGLGKEKFGE